MRRLALAVVLVAVATAGPFAGGGPGHTVAARTEPAPAASGGGSSDQIHIGVVSIPRIKVSGKVYSGVTDRQFAHGFGHWPGTARAGARGNMVISAHRTSQPRLLFDIDKIRVGDAIYVRQGRRAHVYVVTRSFVVGPRDVWIVDKSRAPILTMFACHPKGSVEKRWVVRARLVSP